LGLTRQANKAPEAATSSSGAAAAHSCRRLGLQTRSAPVSTRISHLKTTNPGIMMLVTNSRGLCRPGSDQHRSALRLGQRVSSRAARAMHIVTIRQQRVACRAVAAAPQQQDVKPEGEVPGMSAYLDSLKWNSDGLVAVIAQVREQRRGRGCCVLGNRAAHGLRRCTR